MILSEYEAKRAELDRRLQEVGEREAVGWNEKCKCNTWAEKKRQFSPRPSYEWVLRSIEAEEQMRRTRALHQRLNKIEL